MTDSSARRLWEAVLGRLQLQTPKATFDTWLVGTNGELLENGALTVSAPTAFAVAWLESRMQELADATASSIATTPVIVRFALPGATPGAAYPGAHQPQPSQERPPNSTLSPTETFESFVPLPENQLAHAAALAVARAPGSAYNPLFIYGGVGLGKTHLLLAIGNHGHAAGLSVEYITAEELTNAYLAAMREKRTKAFRERFWSVDMLLLDDVHAFEGKSARIHEGLLHTLDALRKRGSQIVLASDRPALSITVDKRLQSRLAAGLQADLSTPTMESRVVLLHAFATQAGMAISPDVSSFIATRLDANSHVLKGALTRLLALADLTGRAITPHLARQALAAHLSTADSTLSPQAVLAAVARYYTLPASALPGPRRDREVSAARQLAMHLMHTALGLSADEIGTHLGGRDRTTIIYGLRRIADRLQTDATLTEAVASIRDSLTGGESLHQLSTSA
ncbi:MAG: chromosomal replication initiator protein DnaA [Chloroflexota bacterium]|nr:chromosomal replication initiator protein DnaA [Chloroflexota bacterium]MDE2886405.1 chromosomal replication initiator protein DnaA [Chloroflexota bacterium]